MTLSLLSSMIFLTSCKTTEEIRREKLVDTMSVQVEQQSKQVVDTSFKVQEIEERLNSIYGQLEETQHEGKQRILEKEKERIKTITEVNERLNLVEKKIEEIDQKLQTQNDFIQEVTEALRQLQPKKSSKKSPGKGLYFQAMEDFNKNKYKSAATKFKKVLGTKGIRASRKVYSWYYLGIMDYNRKKYEDSMVYMSKIYTEYPKSSKASGA